MKSAVAAVASLAMFVSATGVGHAQGGRPSPDDELAVRPSTDVQLVTADRIKGETEGYWIVTLEDAPVATYTGGVAGLNATSPAATGAPRIDIDTDEARAYQSYLDDQQDQVIEAITAQLGRTLDITYRYTNALNGISVWLTPEEASQVLRTRGVADIERNRVTELTTDLGPAFIGAPAIWDGSANGVASLGEGIVVGILDSGINPSNAAFAATGSDGYTHVNPYGGDVYVGACDPTNLEQSQVGFDCTSKLIGAYDFFADDDNRGINSFDHDGHGSHTASTTAGNVTEGAGPNGETISGVAPHANIISYRVCGDDALGEGYCLTDGTVAAVDQAIADGVDVLNYSVGSPTPTDPWSSADDLAFLAARTAGIFVAHSAGNSGPNPATTGSPGGPWMAHVAALTHDRPALNQLIGMAGGSSAPPADIAGQSGTTAEYTAAVVYAGDLPQYILAKGVGNNALCAVDAGGGVSVSPWPAGTFDGEIVVCDRGVFGRVEKADRVAESGAGGFILADDGGGEVSAVYAIPGIHIDEVEGASVKEWVSAWNGQDPQPTATITAAVASPDSTASFSSRGPNRGTNGDTLMPTIGGPGVNIWAAHGKYDEDTYTYLSGTSMASPHVAGAAALLAAVQPTWSPAEIQSAMETTATTAATKEDGVTPADPFDIGSGRVRVDVAATAGLVLDEAEADYIAADPALGGDPTTINNAHLAASACLLRCTFIRTVTSTAPGAVEWTVTAEFDGDVTATPSAFTVDPGESQDIQFDVDVTSLPDDAFAFGEITLTPDTTDVPAAHFPIAIQPLQGDLPGRVDLVTRRAAGSDLVRDVTAGEITDFVTSVDGLVVGSERTEVIPEDPTFGDPYDDSVGVFTELVEVPEGTTYAVFQIGASESPDADLFVGRDLNGDGLASENELVAESRSSTSSEKVVIDDPAAGTWWVLVQNWLGSDEAPDAITLTSALLDGSDTGTVTIEGPAVQPPLDPFDLRVSWNLDDPQDGDIYVGVVTLGTDGASPDNIGTIPVTIRKVADDVTKSASAGEAERGDTIDYEITVQPNVLSEDLAYTITDSLPDGLTVVDGSWSATSGDLALVEGALTWTGVMPTGFGVEGTYTYITNIDDPVTCAIPNTTPEQPYLDLSTFNIQPAANVEGDSVAFSAFATTMPPTEFYEDPTAGITFTDDGFAYFDSNTGIYPFWPAPIGQPHWATGDLQPPNDMMAPFWTDMEIFYDAAAGRGVSLAMIGTDASIIEFDDLEPWNPAVGPVPGAPTIDFEIVNRHVLDPTPGAWEFAFAYDNVPDTFPSLGSDVPVDLTIGVENEAGDAGTEIFSGKFDGGMPVSDGLVICFDYERPGFAPVTITYQATVDADYAGGTLVNEAESTIASPGFQTETTSAAVEVSGLTPRDQIRVVRDAIHDYPSTGDWVADLRLSLAERRLTRALRDVNWIDDQTLAPRRGQRVFAQLAAAAHAIARADRRIDDDLSGWSDALVKASRELAAAALPAERSSWAATYFFERAERTRRSYGAIVLYGVAWDFAT